MNQRLSRWLLFGALLVWQQAASGQEMTSRIRGMTMLNTPSLQREDPAETLRRSGRSVSARELTIPERAMNAYKRGVGRLTKRDPAGSLAHFQRAISKFPNFYEAYYAMGLAQLTLGHEEEAQQAFQKSIDASGGHYAEPHFGLSVLLCSRQDYAAAEPIIRKALELAPAFGPGHFILAWVLVSLNRMDEAERNAHEALVRDPDLALAHLLLANIYIRRGGYSTVLVELDAYLRLKPDGPLSDQVRLAQESLKGKLARSIVIVSAPRAKP